MRSRALLLVVTVLAAAATTGCLGSGGSARAQGSGDGPQVVTSFYPLQFVTERIAGDAVTVHNLTKPGAEPHDLELTPRDVAELADADLVVYLSGFQPAVDTAVAEQASTSYDVAGAADLDAKDPHFWLDPVRLADVADTLADRLAQLSPGRRRELPPQREHPARRPDGSWTPTTRPGSPHCASTDLVTSHAAFGYLAERYGLTQRGITGLRPEDEPSPGALAEIADFVTAHDVRTIYSETLVSPAVAKTLARETGVRTAVLDPIEGLDDASAGADYLAVMRTNLATLRDGQVPCPMTDEVFRLRDGVIGYGDRPVLRDVDFTLRVGEVVAVLGPNGSGKSTLVKALLRQAQITAGTLEVFGTEVGKFREWWRIGYVPQRHTVSGGMPVTAGEVVTSGRLARTRPWLRFGPADRAAVSAAMETVGLGGSERHNLATLSGGQQRRVLIARALAAGPEVLVMDEPTAGVDAASQASLAVTLAELVARGTTVLLVAHELGPVASLISRTVVVRDGAIFYDGPPRRDAPEGSEHDHPHGDSAPASRFGLGG